MPNSALPDHLKGKLHNDYIWPFCYIPRGWTSFKLKQPPKLLAGSKYLEFTEKTYKDGVNKVGVDPCQHIGWAWALTWPLHLTFTIPIGNGKGWYVRMGCRWDTIDDYYTIPAIYQNVIKLLPKTEQKIYYRGVARI